MGVVGGSQTQFLVSEFERGLRFSTHSSPWHVIWCHTRWALSFINGVMGPLCLTNRKLGLFHPTYRSYFTPATTGFMGPPCMEHPLLPPFALKEPGYRSMAWISACRPVRWNKTYLGTVAILQPLRVCRRLQNTCFDCCHNVMFSPHCVRAQDINKV